MTLGNMRANGVRSLAVLCWRCHHKAVLSADPWPMAMSRDQRRALRLLAAAPNGTGTIDKEVGPDLVLGGGG
jgi:hypothetical protein